MKISYIPILIILICLITNTIANAQSADTAKVMDTNFFFVPKQPLIVSDSVLRHEKNMGGFELLLSNSGIGFGVIYERALSYNYKFISELFFSGIKNTDELEIWWDYSQYDYVVANKVRRIYVIPATIGIARHINILKTFRPYIALTTVPTYIWEMPYEGNWFDDVKDSKGHFRIGGGIQVGADFNGSGDSYIGVKIRYNYVPFGGDGLESVKDSPIKNFGGFYLSIALGGFF